ncbi:50S ribosomal protein L11 methyltransferase [Patescibacteria group bacterium]|nr:50S ribosomal protein L11 methyltransferase [Patescibacteria group bacterium]MCL5798193.1 50S ribosomal protein L11 methyltransferase [Patescibacteria group bacterium]
MLYSYFKLRQYYKKHDKSDLPFVPSRKERIKAMIELSGVQPGEKSLDLGAGDGRIVIAFAQKGASASGVEIDNILFDIANHNVRKKRLEKKARIIKGDFWQEDFGKYDIITIWGLRRIMGRLEDKLQKEAKPGCRILCNYFDLPTWPPAAEKENVFLYIKK